MTSFAYLFAERNSHHPRHNNSRVLLISRHPSLVWCSHFALLRFFPITLLLMNHPFSVVNAQNHLQSSRSPFFFSSIYSMLLIKQQNERMNGSETS